MNNLAKIFSFREREDIWKNHSPISIITNVFEARWPKHYHFPQHYQLLFSVMLDELKKTHAEYHHKFFVKEAA